jgi:uncharacterized coiled-coil protein SlyX
MSFNYEKWLNPKIKNKEELVMQDCPAESLNKRINELEEKISFIHTTVFKHLSKIHLKLSEIITENTEIKSHLNELEKRETTQENWLIEHLIKEEVKEENIDI